MVHVMSDKSDFGQRLASFTAFGVNVQWLTDVSVAVVSEKSPQKITSW